VSRYTVDRTTLQAPFSLNWSVGWEQKLPGSIYFATDFIRRHGRNTWAYSLAASGGEQGQREATYQLDSDQTQSYSYLELTAKRMFKEKFYTVFSYARSGTRTSAVIDFSLENPIFSQQASGPRTGTRRTASLHGVFCLSRISGSGLRHISWNGAQGSRTAS